MKIPGFDEPKYIALRQLSDRAEMESAVEEELEIALNRVGIAQTANVSKKLTGAWKSVSRPRDAVALSTYMLFNKNQHDVEALEKTLNEDLKVFGYAPLTQTSNSIVLMAFAKDGSEYVLRFSLSDENIVEDNERSKAPHMLQGCRLAMPIGNKSEVQILNYAHVMDNVPIEQQVAFNDLMKELYKDTCYEVSRIDEMVVLPNGAIVMLDPVAIAYNDDFKTLSDAVKTSEIERSNELVFKRCHEFGLAENLVPFDKNGELKPFRPVLNPALEPAI